ncbi:Proteasome subunit beta type-4, partial [Frankliniella fusca]
RVRPVWPRRSTYVPGSGSASPYTQHFPSPGASRVRNCSTVKRGGGGGPRPRTMGYARRQVKRAAGALLVSYQPPGDGRTGRPGRLAGWLARGLPPPRR